MSAYELVLERNRRADALKKAGGAAGGLSDATRELGNGRDGEAGAFGEFD